MNPKIEQLTELRTTIKQNVAFVCMPFGNSHDRFYQSRLKTVLNLNGLKSIRADQILNNLTNESFLQTIWTHISLSDIIVIDLSNLNSNVLYELGYAHASNKNCVLICERNYFDQHNLPSNISQLPIIFYRKSGEDDFDKLMELKINAIMSGVDQYYQ